MVKNDLTKTNEIENIDENNKNNNNNDINNSVNKDININKDINENNIIKENIVEIKGLEKSYEKGNIKALNGIDLDIKEGEFVSIIGPSGSGKSTLLNMLGALDIADSGTINVAGYDLSKNKNLDEFRSKKIGFIFQLHNLIPQYFSS